MSAWERPRPPQMDEASGTPEEVSSNLPLQPRPSTGMLLPALWWADSGFVVMPLARLGNRPHPMLGKFGSFKTVGSRNHREIMRWWVQDPWANIGLVTGSRSHLLVIDCDMKHGDGVKTFQQWCLLRNINLDGVPYVDTPSGGRHYYFRHDHHIPSPTSWLDDVDVRGDGAQVATAPGVREKGGEYLSYVAHGDVAHPPQAPNYLAMGVHVRYSSKKGGHLTEIDLKNSPAILWFVANGLGGHSGSRDQDALILSRKALNQFGGDRAVAFTVVCSAYYKTDTQNPHPFTLADLEKCFESALRYYDADVASIPDWRPSWTN
jgi:hypothetical protein